MLTKERLDEIERMHKEINESGLFLPLGRGKGYQSYIVADAIRDLISAVRGGELVAEALEQAAKLVSPHGKRPCDCDVCDCGKRDDAQRVADWDQADRNATAIRKLAATAPPRAAQPPALTDDEVLAWAYRKLMAFGVGNASQESAMMMDRLNALLGGTK